MKFMTDEVTPAMADLLGVPFYDPRTRSAFGYFGCHTMKGSMVTDHER